MTLSGYKILNYGSAFLLIYFLLLTPVHGAALLQTTTAASLAETTKDPKQKDITLVDVLLIESSISKRLIDLHNDIEDTIDLADLQEKFPGITKEIENLSRQITMAKSDPLLNFEQLVFFESKLHREKIRLKKISAPLAGDIGKLARWNKEWTAKQKKLDEWKAKQVEDDSFRLAEQHIENLASSVETARALIEKKIKPMLSAALQINDLQTKVYALVVEVDNLVGERRASNIEQTAPSLFSAAFFRQINMKLWKDTWHNITTFTLQQKKLVSLYRWHIALAAAVILVLSIFISRSGALVKKTAKWHPFTERPATTAAFTFLSLLELYRLIFSETGLPSGWETLLQFIIILAVIRLVAILIQERWKKRILIQASLFLALTLMLKMVHLPHPLVRLYIFYASVFGVLFYLRHSWKRRSVKESQWKKWILLLCGLFPAGILIAEISGYDAVALYLFRSLLYTVVVALVLWMLFLVTSSASELILYRAPIAILRNNAPVLVKQITPAVALFFYILFLVIILVVWQLYPSSEEAFQSLSSFGISIGFFTITPGFILAVVAVLYGALLVSRAIQAVLLQEVLPRYGAEIGVQLSITRLVHYAIFLIGFFILLRVLGFELSQLTILGGALGVGIGFGLQAIVNNFASGLILLFERPIKVGDTIQVGTDMGEVKKLGLRATVVQTFDNAEIVVPNSDLITGQVINWTLAERRVRVKVPVGVAYGTDIAKVLEVFLSCASENPLVLTQPPPRALFLAFGASSLDFELRVWISEFSNRRQVLSELNQDIDYEFQKAGIEIPFPQTDLHLRSVDADAAAALSGAHSPSGKTE